MVAVFLQDCLLLYYKIVYYCLVWKPNTSNRAMRKKHAVRKRVLCRKTCYAEKQHYEHFLSEDVARLSECKVTEGVGLALKVANISRIISQIHPVFQEISSLKN